MVRLNGVARIFDSAHLYLGRSYHCLFHACGELLNIVLLRSTSSYICFELSGIDESLHHFLDASKKQKNQHDQKNEPDTPAGPVTPTPAIRPGWSGANYEKNQNY